MDTTDRRSFLKKISLLALVPFIPFTKNMQKPQLLTGNMDSGWPTIPTKTVTFTTENDEFTRALLEVMNDNEALLKSVYSRSPLGDYYKELEAKNGNR
jgi:hypothetical protein